MKSYYLILLYTCSISMDVLEPCTGHAYSIYLELFATKAYDFATGVLAICRVVSSFFYIELSEYFKHSQLLSNRSIHPAFPRHTLLGLCCYQQLIFFVCILILALAGTSIEPIRSRCSQYGKTILICDEQ